MVLEGLIQVIQNISNRVCKYPSIFQGNETQTRYSLINPLLKALGWDIEDPEQVRLEYMYADYALFTGGKSIMKIEAKSLNTDLKSGLSQSINYCIQDGTPYFAVTDGRRWEIYETHKAVPLDQKLIVSFDLCSDPADAALQALILWHPTTGKTQVRKPFAPVAGIGSMSSDEQGSRRTLADLQASPHDKPPAKLRFPDGSQKSLNTWKDLCCEIVRWLNSSGKLGTQNCPIQRGERYLVHYQPLHPNGKEFRGGVQVGKLWVETHYDAKSILYNSRLILKHVGQDPAQFGV